MSRRLVPRAKVHEKPGYEHVTERWLIRLNYERLLAFHKAAGKVFIDLDDLDELFERGRIERAS